MSTISKKFFQLIILPIVIFTWTFFYEYVKDFLRCKTIGGWDGRMAMAILGTVAFLFVSMFFYFALKDKIPAAILSLKSQCSLLINRSSGSSSPAVPEEHRHYWIGLIIFPLLLLLFLNNTWRDYQGIERRMNIDDAPAYKMRQLEKCEQRSFARWL